MFASVLPGTSAYPVTLTVVAPEALACKANTSSAALAGALNVETLRTNGMPVGTPKLSTAGAVVVVAKVVLGTTVVVVAAKVVGTAVVTTTFPTLPE